MTGRLMEWLESMFVEPSVEAGLAFGEGLVRVFAVSEARRELVERESAAFGAEAAHTETALFFGGHGFNPQIRMVRAWFDTSDDRVNPSVTHSDPRNTDPQALG